MPPLSRLNNENLQQVLNYLVACKTAFVLYKKPFNETIYLLVSSTENTDTFVLEYFNSERKTTIVGKTFMNADVLKITDLHVEKNIELIEESTNVYSTENEFTSYVEEIVNLCKQNELNKCVAARKIKQHFPPNFSLATAFLNACNLFNNAFVHLSFSDFGLWLGATPELLLLCNGNDELQTVSLAGTKTSNREWTQKEYKEQQIVTDYIVKALKEQKASNINVSNTYTAQAGHLKHLKSDISFKAKNEKSILTALHPTPAVCGTPKNKALHFIEKKEIYKRGFYAGFIGKKGKDGFYYVNLRCMQLFNNYADIYVGAGITQDSNPLKEWKETEEKSKVMKKLLE